ncbi:MAG: fibronectin type III domain-containing protein [Actinomycetota bacterium]|nr:fibronectin type III domain-containing protein [Actinomycetota bacterium]
MTDKDTGATLFDQNPYPTVVNEHPDWPGPLANEPAWSLDAHSWNWEVSRLDLTSLAGQTVGIRFRLGVNKMDGLSDDPDVFYLDDYSVYTCVPLSQVNAPTSVTAIAANRSATVTWTPPVPSGNMPITGYLVTPFANGAAIPRSEQWLDESETSTTFSALQNGTNYTFAVAAEVEGGMGPTSAASNSVIPKLPPISGSLVYIKNNNVALRALWGEPPPAHQRRHRGRPLRQPVAERRRQHHRRRAQRERDADRRAQAGPGVRAGPSGHAAELVRAR